MKASHILLKLTRPFRRFRFYAICCAEEVTSYYEDPRCPWEWRGSGCYDIEVHTLNARICMVTARDKEEAGTVRGRHLESELESGRTLREKTHAGMSGEWRLSAIKDRLGYDMDVIDVRKTDIPLYAFDGHASVIDEILKEKLCETAREKDLKEYTAEKIVQSFDDDIKDWAKEHDRQEIERLTKLVQNESSHLLYILHSHRKKKFGRPQGSKRSAVTHLRQA